jgi:hypothetical protein
MQRRQQLGSWVGGVKSSVLERMSTSTTSVTSTTGSAASASTTTTTTVTPVKMEKDIAVAVPTIGADMVESATTNAPNHPQVLGAVSNSKGHDDDNNEDSPDADAEADGRQAASDTDTIPHH